MSATNHTDATPNMDMQRMIELASQMKNAQPDSIARRARIDAIPFFLKNTLVHSTQEDREMRQNTNVMARQLYAEQLKEQGNTCYREKAYGDASIVYQRAHGIFRYTERIKTQEGDDIQVVDTCESIPALSLPPAYLLLMSLLINMAACHVALEAWDDVLVACKAALEIPCDQVSLRTKAHYRMGLAYQAHEEWKQSIESFQAALQLTPTDSAIRKNLEQVREKQRAQINRDKRTFTGMFDRGSIYDGVPAEAPGPVPVEPDAIPVLPTNSSSSSSVDPFLREYTKQSFQHPTLDRARQQRLEIRTRKREAALAALDAESSDDDSSSSRSSKCDRRGALMAEAERDMLEEEQAQMSHMREAATKFGLDLSDPMVQQELQKLQQEQMEKDGIIPHKTSNTTSKYDASSWLFFTRRTWILLLTSLIILLMLRFRVISNLISLIT